jgi:adenosylmethionine---8-amino-7-oxononanoate aminotransferase
MAASGISFYTQAFQGMFIDVVRIPVPVKGQEQTSFDALNEVIKSHNCAGFIFEPLVQGAAGMVMYQPEALAKLIQICKKNKVLTIADEVMTGFGKTGKTFAMDYVSEDPDMICLSKALTGGTIPMAITTFTQDVFDAFYDDDINKALFHGHTFTANPTGCAAALASIDLLQTNEMQVNIERINKNHLNFQKKIENHPKVITARTLGVIFAVEIKSDSEESYYGSMRTKLYNFFIEKGVVLRPVGNIVYILPPYIMTDKQLEKVYLTIEEAIEMV